MEDRPDTVASAPKLWLTLRTGEHRGNTIEVNRDGFLIGRGQNCDLHIDDPKISREHARVSLRGSRPVLYDLESANGTFVNGRRLRSPTGFTTSPPPALAELNGGEVIQLGDTFITASLVDPSELPDISP